MIKVLLQIFVLYLLYKLIFDFIIPVYKTTRAVKQKMGDMQSKMDMQEEQRPQAAKNTYQKPNRADYIDFEEVK